MLVLRRKVSEAIVLNQVIVIRVLGVDGDRVKLGIDAPPDVIVVREELQEETPTAKAYKAVITSDLPVIDPPVGWHKCQGCGTFVQDTNTNHQCRAA